MAAEAILEQVHDLANNKRMASLISSLCGLILVATVYAVVMDWVQSARAVPPVNIPVTHSKISINDIPKDHLFGASPSSLSRTNLQLTLEGLWTSYSHKKATAIIAQPGQKGKVYLINDTIMPGVTLYQVLSHGVIINNRGKLEELPLVRSKLQFTSPEPSIFDR